MKINLLKGFKPQTIKAIVITMSLFYLLSPIYLEVKMVLHTIVHAIEIPDNVLSHKKESNTQEIHQSKEHKTKIEKHNHNIIDLVGTILQGNKQENESPDALLNLLKIHKHIKVHHIIIEEKILISEKETTFLERKNKLSKGYLKEFKQPPQMRMFL
ncbi:MAG: hypothetical protein AB8B78_05045 [Polaribacter sp.]